MLAITPEARLTMGERPLDAVNTNPCNELPPRPSLRPALGSGPESDCANSVPGVHDFDFIAGVFKVHNRRLLRRGVGCDEWEEFPGVNRGQLHLGSVVNTDEIEFPGKGWSGMTLRCFDVEKRRWAIYWINSRSGRLFPPVHGHFVGLRGEFFGTDDDDGRPVQVRFVWTRIDSTHARWEQAFSYNQGTDWETNWIMQFTRDG